MTLRRRTCMAALALVAPLAARSQPSRRPWHIGWTSAFAGEAMMRKSPVFLALQDGLREQGLLEGRDYVWDARYTGGRPERFEALDRELAAAAVDLMIAGVCGIPLDAALRASRSIPIVVPTCNDDLVELGIVNSLNRPGGNITGLSKLTPDLAPKRLQLLLQALPRTRRVAVLWNPAYAEFKADWRELRAGADKLGVTVLPVEFRRLDDLELVFDALSRLHPDALLMFSDQIGYVYAARVAQHAQARHLPGMYAFREVVDAGGLMSYGPNIVDMWRQSAKHIARILRGTPAGELPIEQPTRFELVINLKTAKALGLTVPQELLLRADEVIE